jgi:hypothetical protein
MPYLDRDKNPPPIANILNAPGWEERAFKAIVLIILVPAFGAFTFCGLAYQVASWIGQEIPGLLLFTVGAVGLCAGAIATIITYGSGETR